jgi:hypothetical protein
VIPAVAGGVNGEMQSAGAARFTLVPPGIANLIPKKMRIRREKSRHAY